MQEQSSKLPWTGACEPFWTLWCLKHIRIITIICKWALRLLNRLTSQCFHYTQVSAMWFARQFSWRVVKQKRQHSPCLVTRLPRTEPYNCEGKESLVSSLQFLMWAWCNRQRAKCLEQVLYTVHSTVHSMLDVHDSHPHKLDMCNKSSTTFTVFAVLDLWVCPGAIMFFFTCFLPLTLLMWKKLPDSPCLCDYIVCVTEQEAW